MVKRTLCLLAIVSIKCLKKYLAIMAAEYILHEFFNETVFEEAASCFQSDILVVIMIDG